jgi:hypothetical protein
MAILLIPPLIPAGIRGIQPESRNSTGIRRNPGILAEFLRNSGGIDRIPARFLAYKYRKSTTRLSKVYLFTSNKGTTNTTKETI